MVDSFIEHFLHGDREGKAETGRSPTRRNRLSVRRGSTPDARRALTASPPRQEEESRGLEKVRRDYHFLFVVLARVGRVLSVWGRRPTRQSPASSSRCGQFEGRTGRRPEALERPRGAAPLNYSAEKGSERQIGPNYLLTAQRADRCSRVYRTTWSRGTAESEKLSEPQHGLSERLIPGQHIYMPTGPAHHCPVVGVKQCSMFRRSWEAVDVQLGHYQGCQYARVA
ncbi:hypothetical protein EYF80_015702 [Liparis tanakae]|uniref:Uncharacterized protein n=1 Tax=Liparis tanakae TaxID=230148 RepID=A0A4Z2I8B7_9TELE|nr:hypothetical protein EYF80_015702 [Liparis tanakae]